MSEKVYWADTYLYTETAKVLEVSGPEAGTDFFCFVLDKTVFYPRGGGQPNDVGTIKAGDHIFEVKDVRLNGDRILHFGHFTSGPTPTSLLFIGDEVALNVDPTVRSLNARLHSAGHLLDNVIQELGLDWVPGKGYHYPDAYVEYTGTAIPAPKRPEVLKQIQEGITNAIAKGYAICVEIVEYDKVAEKCGGVCPDYLPAGKEARIVTINGLGCPCGGTHVKNVSEIGEVIISKITYKKNVIRVSYKLKTMQ